MEKINIHDMLPILGYITFKGLLVENCYYSCRHALLLQWFTPENKKKIQLLFDYHQSNYYYLCPETNNIHKLHPLASRIPLSNEELNIYYEKINRLKVEFKNLKKDFIQVR